MAGTGPAMTKIGSATPSRSHPKIPMLQIGLGDQLFRPAAPHRAAALDDVVAGGRAGARLGLFFLHTRRLPPPVFSIQDSDYDLYYRTLHPPSHVRPQPHARAC